MRSGRAAELGGDGAGNPCSLPACITTDRATCQPTHPPTANSMLAALPPSSPSHLKRRMSHCTAGGAGCAGRSSRAGIQAGRCRCRRRPSSRRLPASVQRAAVGPCSCLPPALKGRAAAGSSVLVVHAAPAPGLGPSCHLGHDDLLRGEGRGESERRVTWPSARAGAPGPGCGLHASAAEQQQQQGTRARRGRAGPVRQSSRRSGAPGLSAAR